MPRDLTDHVIVITGASAGIGAATAIECARAGMDVVLNARRADRLEQTAERVRGIGRRAEIVIGDVTDEGISARMLDAAQSAFGRFDVVFANAGYGMERSILETSDADLRRMFEVNFFASVDLLREAAGRLRRDERRGHLIMCSSCLAKFTLPLYGAYSATKAAQNHICRAMRMELEPAGIQVSSVHPITTRTEFFQVASELSGDGSRFNEVPDHTPKIFVQPPERVARAVVQCLRRPRPEVWTSMIVRATAAAMTFAPSLMDRIGRKELKRTQAHR